MISEWLGGFFLSNVRVITACIMAWLTTSEYTGRTEQYLSFLSNGYKNPRINFLTVMDSSIALFFIKKKMVLWVYILISLLWLIGTWTVEKHSGGFILALVSYDVELLLIFCFTLLSIVFKIILLMQQVWLSHIIFSV